MKCIKNLVLSGGGVNGVSTCGALKRIYELDGIKIKLQLKEILGVSVGAIIGLLLTVGYTPNDIIGVIEERDFSKFIDVRILTMLSNYGLDTGDKIKEFICELLEAKQFNGGITFQELFERTKISLRVTATNIVKHTQVIFDHTSNPEMCVIDAVRMSYSIPFIFTRVYNNGDIHVDGALSDNYPMSLYKDSEETLGIQIISKHGKVEIDSFMSYIMSIINCLKLQLDCEYDDKSTIHIYPLPFTSMKFDIDTNLKKDMVSLGYSASVMYFDSCKE